MAVQECSLYSFTVNGVKRKTTPADLTARRLANEAKAALQGKQDSLTTAQLAAVNSGITAEKVAGYDAFNVPSAFSGSPAMDGMASPGSANAWARGDHVHPHDTSKQDALTTAQQAAVNSGVTAAKVAVWDAIEIPTKTSDLTNDSGFITAAAIPAVPTKTSDLTNDSGFVTSAAIPDSTSDLTNDSGFITASDIPVIPMKTSDLQNDSGFITASDIPAIPSKTSDLQNDSGFITGYTETDPTVPTWAKAPTKPTYTASEVGALPDTTVIPEASSASPQMDGTAAAGTSANYARADHVHPSDSSKQDALTAAQLAAVNSGITVDNLAVNNASVLCAITPISPTLRAGTNYASYGNCYYYKEGHRVTVHIGVSGLTANTRTTLWYMPAGYRPKAPVSAVGIAQDIMYRSMVRISESGGTVSVYSEGTYALIEVSYDAYQ